VKLTLSMHETYSTVVKLIFSMRGTELILYSVCTELRLAYIHYKLNAFEKRSSIIWEKDLEFELILNVRETMFCLYFIWCKFSNILNIRVQ